MSPTTAKAREVRLAGRGSVVIDKDGNPIVEDDGMGTWGGVETYWNQASDPDYTKTYEDYAGLQCKYKSDRAEEGDYDEYKNAFAVFTFETGSPTEAFDGKEYKANVDWVFVADSAQMAAEIEYAAWKRLSRPSRKRSTQVETGIIPDADKTSHYARRRFTF